MKELNRTTVDHLPNYPIKILQFGEGNFLRAFVDYAIDTLNKKCDFNAGVAVIQPLSEGMVKLLNQQDGLYTLFMKGIWEGKEIQEKELISSIVQGVNPYQDFKAYLSLAQLEELEFVISNTTEAGISFNPEDRFEMEPPSSFPGKLTRFLFERFEYFKGEKGKGLTIIPCELINYNAHTLKKIILQYIELWNLGDGFKQWILQCNDFHNTLVDRIVPGYPKDDIEAYNAQLDYQDNLIVSAEKFFLWVIEADEKLKSKLPFHKTDLDVKIVTDMQPYRTRKVRILNGAHTTMVPFSILYGNETVKQTVDNPFTGSFVQQAIFQEIIPTLEMDRQELEQFAQAVLDRFRNPFIKHMLSSIALNSISKFKVRVLPSLLAYVELKGRLPVHLTFALACLIRFYKSQWNDQELPVKDDAEVEAIFKALWQETSYDQISEKALSFTELWDRDLTKINGLCAAVSKGLSLIDTKGIEEGFQEFIKQVGK